jgi:hypothetical protein
MKKSTIIFIELGVLSIILLMGVMLHGSIGLRACLVYGGACFLLGNFLLAANIERLKSVASPAGKGPWPHILRALVILAIFSLLASLLSKR